MFLLLRLGVNVDAQTAPYFMTTIWVKDAMGNRDSVVLGYNPENFQFDTVQFGSITVLTPFDATLDMRVGYEITISSTEPLYKRLITHAETGSGCTKGPSFVLYINAVFQPITLFWDRSVFDPAHCREDVFFTPDRFATLSDPPNAWVDSGGPIIFSCAAKSDSMVYTLNPNIVWPTNPEFFPMRPYTIEREIEGFGLDTVVGIALLFPFGGIVSPCSLAIGTESPGSLPNQGFSIQPNPVGDSFFLYNERTTAVKNVRFFDALGRLVWEKRQFETDEYIDCTAWNMPPGVYFLTLKWADGYESCKKMLKR